jgi:nucleotide-binding universal stress UspA family protein
MPTIKKILVPVDFTESSNHALYYAVDLAVALGAAVSLLHVFEPPVYSMADAVIVAPPEMVAEISDKAQQMLDSTMNSHRKRCPGISGSVVKGAAWEEIGRVAVEQNADLIVMGTHGRRGLSRAILGSVAERVVRTSKVPVLTVGPRDPS